MLVPLYLWDMVTATAHWTDTYCKPVQGKRKIDRQRDRQIDRLLDRGNNRHADTQTETERQMDRQTGGDRETEQRKTEG